MKEKKPKLALANTTKRRGETRNKCVREGCPTLARMSNKNKITLWNAVKHHFFSRFICSANKRSAR